MVKTELKRQNQALVQHLLNRDIHQVNFIVVGNSLAAGYTLAPPIKLFLERNGDLFAMLRAAGVVCKSYHFCSPHDNSNREIYEWLTNNLTVKETWKKQEKYYLHGQKHEVDKYLIDSESLYQLFSNNLAENIGLMDVLARQKPHHVNILLYFGCTGEIMAGNYQKVGRELYYLDKFLWKLKRINPQVLPLVLAVPEFEHEVRVVFNPLIKWFNKKIAYLKNRYENLGIIAGAKVKVVKRDMNDSVRYRDVHPDENGYEQLLVVVMRGVNEYLEESRI